MAATSITASRPHRLAAVCLTVALLLTAMVGAAPAVADTAPQPPETVRTVAADSLPTVQVNGVVWDQVIVGDRVYVTGSFTRARPAGAAAGSNESVRSNALAYDLATGSLIAGWAPSLNAQGLTIAASGDGRVIYLGGDFTTVNGASRSRIAAVDAQTGALVGGFTANVNNRVYSIAVAGSTLYLGGYFTAVAGQARSRLAAVNAATGALNGQWRPTADRAVLAVVAPAGSGKVVVAGRLETLNGVPALGMGAVDATTGATLPWKINQTVQNYGPNAAIWSLATDNTRVYGTAYDYQGPSEFEGSFAASVADGSIIWLNACKGDTYDAAPVGDVLYSVGHPHDCAMIGGYPQTTPWTYQRAMATTSSTDGVNAYGPFAGQPKPRFLAWDPTLATGTYTGQGQAAWTVTGNDRYVLLGGEFPQINDAAQQGLARFAVSSIAPNREGPLGGSELKPTATSLAVGAVTLGWTAAYDRDNRTLSYEVLRGSTVAGSTVLATISRDSAWWNRPGMSFTDTAAPVGSTQTYRIRVRDPFGNTLTSAATSFTVPSGLPPVSAYASGTLDLGAAGYWRLGEPSGATAYDWAGSNDVTLAGDVARSTQSAIVGDVNGSANFPGTTGVPGVARTSMEGPQVFSVEAWIKTTTTRGGKIVGFGNSATGDSSNYDRHLYMDDEGRITFGVYPGAVRRVTSDPGHNDGRWHHIAATLGSSGMALFIDGVRIAGDAGVTSAQSYTGYWRIGGDNLTGWPAAGSSSRFAGLIDEVAVYPTALSTSQIAARYAAGVGTGTPNQVPAASFTASVSGLQATFDGSGSSDPDGSIVRYAWEFGDGGTAATGPAASHTYASAGTFTVRLTVTDDRGATGTTTRSVTTVEAANQVPAASFTASVSGLQATFDGSGSSDPDGSIVRYAWEFGDGGTAATGPAASHTYAAAGTFTVRLTVTDDRGATGTTTRSVTTVAAAFVALDTFSRTVVDGLGQADVGGAWSTVGTPSRFAVADGRAEFTHTSPATQYSAALPGAAAAGADLRVQVSVSADSSGSGTYIYISGRRVEAANRYDARLRWIRGNLWAVALTASKNSATAVTMLTGEVVLPVRDGPGSTLNLRLQVVGSSPTTIRVKAWPESQAEPAAWLLERTDSHPALQTAGHVGLQSYLSGSATVIPVTVRFDNLEVRPL